MAEFSARQVVAIAAAAGALVGGAVAAGVAGTVGSHGSTGSSPGGSGPVSTAPVVRTTLTTTEQVGGSIGYGGFYTVTDPSGASSSAITQDQQSVTQDQGTVAQDRGTVTQDQQTVTQDRVTLAADRQAASDTSATDNQVIAADEANVKADKAILAADQAKESYDCTYTEDGCSSQDAAQVRTDQTTLAQDEQKLAAARLAAKTDASQDQAKVLADQAKIRSDQVKVQSDEAKVQSDQAEAGTGQTSLASLQATAVNPGTTYTWLPRPGQVIKQDQPVYAVSGEPVPLLYGAIPAYRAFYDGMPDGADVGELTHDLVSLGYGAGLVQSNHYSAATAAAVRRWQRARGLPATGKILLGAVVFEPGPIRVTSVTPSAGSSAGGSGDGGSSGDGGGTVLTATGITPIVTVDLDVTQEYLVKPGDAVSVVLPDGTSTVGGQVETVGTVATCPGGGGTGTGNSSADQSTCESSGSGSSSTPTVTVTITLHSTPAGASLDQAPVNVNITSQTVPDVLAVPVTALLSLQGGGYGVDVVTGKASHLVGVTTGVYSDTLVQISGPGITAGTVVEVASS